MSFKLKKNTLNLSKYNNQHVHLTKDRSESFFRT